MPLTGTLRDLNLFNLVQLQCIERQHAEVFLRRGDCAGKLVFADGELIFASAGGLVGEEAVHEMLTWDDAEFRVDHGAVTAPQNVHGHPCALLIDGIRRMDEARAKQSGQLESLLARVKGADGLRAAVVVNGTDHAQAAAAEGPGAADGALASFLAGRVEAVGKLLSCGAITEALFAGAAEKVWMVGTDGSHLACWLEGHVALAPLKGLLQAPVAPVHEDPTG